LSALPHTYSNPIIGANLADPFMLRAADGYYLFASHAAPDGRFVPVWHSADLAEWRFVRGAVAAGPADAWNRRNFWAPEIMFAAGRYHLYYTAMPDGTPGNTGNRVGLAVSGTPAGPFEDCGPVVNHASLDGSPFVDADGSAWLYFTAEFGNDRGLVPGRSYVDRLLAPDRAAGDPREVMGLHPWQEGPCLLRRGGRCYLFYSTGSWGDASYGVRWAVGDSPLGPFAEAPRALLSTTDKVKGPGHHNFFTGPDGSDWIVYHGWDPDFKARYPRIDPMAWTPDGPTTHGPTSGSQPFPTN
jgi:beta-xylosidase